MKQWMDRGIKEIGDFKFLTGMYFMGSVIVYMMVAMAMGVVSIPIMYLWQILLASILGAGMQVLFLESNLLKKWHMKQRVIAHAISVYATLVVLSQIFQWVVLGPSILLWGTLIYIFLYATIFWAFYIYYKTEGNVYQQKLNEFKKKRS